MATCNPTLDLIEYVEQRRLPLISKTVLGTTSTKYFTLMTGVKGTTTLNIMNTDPKFTCGNTCGWHEDGETSFSQKIMCVLPLNVHMAFCDKNLLDTWANYEVKVAAGLKNLPFEEEWTNNIIKNVKKNIEIAVWNGIEATAFDCETGDESDTPCTCPGILAEIADAPSAEISEDDYTNGEWYKIFIETFNALADEVKAADDLVAFVGYDVYYKLIQDIMATSHFHIASDDLEDGFTFPGTGVKVIPTVGLADLVYKDIIVIGRASNFFYGTDLRNDEEKFDLWYSKDNREFRLAIEFTMGAAVAFPEETAHSWHS